MNVIDSINKLNKAIETYEVESNKHVTIKVISSYNNKSGIYKLVGSRNKYHVHCREEDRAICDKVCKDYCLLFESRHRERIWTCYIDKWKRL